MIGISVSMEEMMTRKLAAAALMAAGLVTAAGLASAQHGGGMGREMMGPGRGMMGGDCPMMGMMAGRADTPAYSDGRIAFLKAELAITPAQQPAWDAYAAALRRNLTSMQGMRGQMQTAMAAKTPVERLDAHVAAMEGRVAALKELKPTLAALYGVLGDEQKKQADQILAGMGCHM